MAISQRTRYEVLRRDGYTCRYCGATAPDAHIGVDHVKPVSLGGSDYPDNLVAACFDCNAGKASSTPDTEVVTSVTEDDVRWAGAVKRAADAMLQQHKEDLHRHAWFLEEWLAWDGNGIWLPSGWEKSLDHWLAAGLPKEVLLDCHHIAMGNRGVSADNVFAYMGGIARKRVADLHQAAREILDDEGPNEAEGGELDGP